MQKLRSYEIHYIAIIFVLTSCAGPENPFGSNYFISKEFVVNNDITLARNNSIRIEGSPAVKLFNTDYNLRIKLRTTSKFDQTFRYDIIYNNRKLSRWWKSENIIISSDRKNAIIQLNKLSLIPGIRNDIIFLFYPNKDTTPLSYHFQAPSCELNYQGPLSFRQNFSKGYSYSRQINSSSGLHNINSNLLASLVAQESSFDPKAVSWAKAIGLTQITPLANIDIQKIKPHWKSYPNITKMSYPTLRYKIFKGQINHVNDWRLNSNRSLEGGAIFLQNLITYWNKKQNKQILERTFKNIPLTDIVLASYNSGAFRVKRNLLKKKQNWLWANELKEAQKYVMNIKSYCHQLESGGTYAN